MATQIINALTMSTLFASLTLLAITLTFYFLNAPPFLFILPLHAVVFFPSKRVRRKRHPRYRDINNTRHTRRRHKSHTRLFTKQNVRRRRNGTTPFIQTTSPHEVNPNQTKHDPHSHKTETPKPPMVVAHPVPTPLSSTKSTPGCTPRQTPSSDPKDTTQAWSYRPFTNCLFNFFSSDSTPISPLLIDTLLNSINTSSDASHVEAFPIIWDTGASRSVTFDAKDFDGPPTPIPNCALQGLAKGLTVVAEGIVTWTVLDDDGLPFHWSHLAYLIPDSPVRLLSCQSYQNYAITHLGHQYEFVLRYSQPGYFRLQPDSTTTRLSNPTKLPTVTCHLDPRCNLPISQAYRSDESSYLSANPFSTLSLDLLDPTNQNLSPGAQELLRWHFRLGHLGMQSIQTLLRGKALGDSLLIKAAIKCSILPRCASCQFGKQRRRHTEADLKLPVTTHSITVGNLQPGERVSVDHFIGSTRGRLYSSRGQSKPENMYSGGCIFIDHASSFIHNEHQVSLTTHETLQSKHAFERVCFDMGVGIQAYQCDNGVFTSVGYTADLTTLRQHQRLAGVGAHHQNGVVERAIQTIMSMARTMFLHAFLHWPDFQSLSNWPMAVDYAVFIYNHCPNRNNGVAPIDVMTRTFVPRQRLINLHVWGCPAYVLDPRLQDGRKIPRWQPRSRRGIFVGFSRSHASTIPLILNTQTLSISPQFHVVFDDWFSTIARFDNASSRPPGTPDPDVPPAAWYELFELTTSRFCLDFDASDNPDLAEEWLDADELAHRRYLDRQDIARHIPSEQRESAVQLPLSAPTTADFAPPPSLDSPQPPLLRQSATPTHPNFSPSPSQRERPPLTPQRERPRDLQREPSRELQREHQWESQREPLREFPPASPQREPPSPRRLSLPPREPELPPHQRERHNTRPTRSRKPPTYLADHYMMHFSNYTALHMAQEAPAPMKRHVTNRSSLEAYAYLASMMASDALPFQTWYELSNEEKTRQVNFDYAAVYANLASRSDPDTFMYHEAMQDIDKIKWLESMQIEIDALKGMHAWDVVTRSKANGHRVYQSTWTFRRKRFPDGRTRKHKGRFCLRGDLQIDGIDVFDTYAPVVTSSTVRLILVIAMTLGLHTRCIDFTNAFVHAILKPHEHIFLELPKGWEDTDVPDPILHLRRSLYGDKEAPRRFFDCLKEALIAIGFEQSEYDPCLFLRNDVILVSYVDDCVLVSSDPAAPIKVMEELRARHFSLTDEGDLANYLGIEFARDGSHIEAKQTGLIDKVIQATRMEESNACATPATTAKGLGSDPDGPLFSEPWDYRSVLGMLLCVSGNTRPDIAFAVSQCARFTHSPRESHGKALIKIIRYLKGTRDRGIIYRTNGIIALDCFVDADYCGLWGSEEPTDKMSVRSRSGYIFTFAGCPFHWVSRLQDVGALSTMEAEYIALSDSCRQTIPLRNILSELLKCLQVPMDFVVSSKSTVYEDNNGALALARLPHLTPRSKHIAVRYHFFRDHVQNESLVIEKIDTTVQLADICTKGLPDGPFQQIRKLVMGW